MAHGHCEWLLMGWGDGEGLRGGCVAHGHCERLLLKHHLDRIQVAAKPAVRELRTTRVQVRRGLLHQVEDLSKEGKSKDGKSTQRLEQRTISPCTRAALVVDPSTGGGD